MNAAGTAPVGSRGDSDGPARERPRWVWAMAAGAAALTLLSNVNGLATGDDGVGYRAIADSLLAGDGLGYFLEDPVTVWPPLWPALMAGLAKFTPLTVNGAAVVLNALTVALLVVLGHRLLRRCVVDDRLVLLGTVVLAFGPVTQAFGHLLMTDLAFACVVVAWMLALMRFHDTGASRHLVGASLLVWVGFGLRYVSLYLLALGGLWLLFDSSAPRGDEARPGRDRVPFVHRLRNGVLYGALGLVVPAAWMLRNRSIDGTFTGERHGSARGLVDNGFDILSTMGRWILPGVAEDAKYLWAAVGGVVLLIAAWLGWRVLAAAPRANLVDTPWHRFWRWIGSPTGLLAVQAFGYLTYMLYVRTTTALNQLDPRLLNPAYVSLVALALVLVDRLRVLGTPGHDAWGARGRAVVHVWAAANVLVAVVGVIGFATGDPFFSGNYESEDFRRIRAEAALAALPPDCEVYSNLPNGLYPELGAQWSPRRTALESDDPEDDLAELVPTLGSRPACLVWIDREPRYGHLFTRDELEDELDLEELSSSGVVTVYRMQPAS